MRLEIADEFRRGDVRTAEALRDGLQGRLRVLQGRATCVDCGGSDDLSAGGRSGQIEIRCGTCWDWEAVKQRRGRMRSRSRG